MGQAKHMPYTARTWFMIQLCPHIFRRRNPETRRLDLGLFKVNFIFVFYQDKSPFTIKINQMYLYVGKYTIHGFHGFVPW